MLPFHLLVAVGSRYDQMCSVGAFARVEASALRSVFQKVSVLEPTSAGEYPEVSSLTNLENTPVDVILFHAPSLHDRKKPWFALKSAWKLKKSFPHSLFVSMIHEYSEAPKHWRLRQALILKFFSDAAIANSFADFSSIKRLCKNTLRSRLGPTLFSPALATKSLEDFAQAFQNIREKVAAHHNFPLKQKWVVHPGLLTPGKGINLLERIIPALDSNTRLILMGGLGPKEKDRVFAKTVIQKLKHLLADRFSLIEAPPDETYKEVLFASDLVVLPYDNGLSERRSSFLSAMSCGANVWTTYGPFSDKMQLEASGSFYFPVETWLKAENESANLVVASLKKPLLENPELVLSRRRKNLEWAKNFSWETRAKNLAEFISKLKR